MSVRAIAYVKTLEGVSRAEKLVLFVLADYYNDEEQRAWPSIARLAHEALLTPRSVIRNLRRLEQKGVLATEHRRRRDGSATSSSYCFTALTPPDTLSGAPDTSVRGPLTLVSAPPDASDRGPLTAASDHEPLVNRQEEPSSSSSEEAEDFLQWYTELPDGFTSPLRAPSHYFNVIRKNGDPLPAARLQTCTRIIELVRLALVGDHPPDSPRRVERFMVPKPNKLADLETVWFVLDLHQPEPQTLRSAIMSFVCADDGKEPEVSPHDLLPRIAERPDVFSRAVEQASLPD